MIRILGRRKSLFFSFIWLMSICAVLNRLLFLCIQMASLKQELERAEERIECVEYRSAERAGEIEETLDTYVTRVRM